MDQARIAAIVAFAGLLALVAWQAVRISGLEGRLAVLERHSLEQAEAAPRHAMRGGAGPVVRARDVTGAPSAGAATTEPASREAIAELVVEETRRAEAERRERGREMWLAGMADEIERFAEEEQLTQDQTDQLQLYAEDYLLTITDFRRAIFEGEISPEAGREEMKSFRAEHEQRMHELIGEEAYDRLQRRIGRGGRER